MNGTDTKSDNERLQRPIKVVYQDDSYFVVDKPYDCRIQPDRQNPLHLSVEKLIQQQHPELPPLKNVHQIDYATSGIYVQALTRKAAAKVSKLFEQRRVEKTYLAIVHGHMIPDVLFTEPTTPPPPPIIVDQPIGNDPSHPFRMAILPDGKPSFTTINILQQGYYQPSGGQTRVPVTKVLLSPKTGRRHQLRVHLQSIGHPIVGDYNYEVPYTDTFRMMLHAFKIQFPLPSGTLSIGTLDPFKDLIH